MMNWKKNVFSYVFWLIYTLTTVTALVFLMSEITGGTQAGIPGAVAVVAAAGALVFLLYRFAPKYCCDRGNHAVRNVTEAAIVVVLLAVGLVLRVRSMEQVSGDLESYFEMAEVLPGKSIPRQVHGAVYFYVRLLHMVFYFLGNKSAAGIGLQIALQLLAIFVFYLAVCRLNGRLAGLTVLTLLCCSPYMIEEALRLSPGMLYGVVAAVALLIVSAGTGGRLRGYLFVGIGMVAAIPTFLDIAGLLVLFTATAVACQERDNPAEIKQKASALIGCLLGFFLGMVLCFAADVCFSGKAVGGVLQAYFTLYRPESFVLPVSVVAAESCIEWIVLFGLMSLGIFTFWCNPKREYHGANTVITCLAVAAACFGVFTNEMPGDLWIVILLAVAAGISVEGCFRTSEPVTESRNEFAAPDAKDADNAEEASDAGDAHNAETPEAESVEMEQEKQKEKKKVQLFETPLPLPKKHVKRVLDYDINEEPEPVEPAEDDYDIQVAEDDDFDI